MRFQGGDLLLNLRREVAIEAALQHNLTGYRLQIDLGPRVVHGLSEKALPRGYHAFLEASRQRANGPEITDMVF
jgi:hypothetical protein